MLLTPEFHIRLPLKSASVLKSTQVDQAGQGSTKTRRITPYVPRRLRYESEGPAAAATHAAVAQSRFTPNLRQLCALTALSGSNSRIITNRIIDQRRMKFRPNRPTNVARRVIARVKVIDSPYFSSLFAISSFPIVEMRDVDKDRRPLSIESTGDEHILSIKRQQRVYPGVFFTRFAARERVGQLPLAWRFHMSLHVCALQYIAHLRGRLLNGY